MSKISVREQIEEIVNRETRAWDTQDVSLLLSVFHADMVWPWPPTAKAHNPIDWVFVLGRFDEKRWNEYFEDFFASHTLVHNKREIKKIEITKEADGAFAVVDIDTLWMDNNHDNQHWNGRVCKVYAKVGEEWQLTMHTGVLDYPA